MIGGKGTERLKQLAAENRDRLTAELHAVARHANPDNPAARRGLVADELAFTQARRPERAEGTVRRARHRVLGDARSRREETRDEIVTRRAGAAGDDHSADGQGGERRVVRLQAPDGLFAVHLDQVVELISAHVLRRGAERLGEPGGYGGGLLTLGREIELDPLAGAVARQKAALRVKPRLLRQREVPFFSEHVRAGERRVAAESHLGRRREPPEREAVVALAEKRGLGEVHLAGDPLHPALVARRGQEADRRGVARERRVGERVDLRDPETHDGGSVATKVLESSPSLLRPDQGGLAWSVTRG